MLFNIGMIIVTYIVIRLIVLIFGDVTGVWQKEAKSLIRISAMVGIVIVCYQAYELYDKAKTFTEASERTQSQLERLQDILPGY